MPLQASTVIASPAKADAAGPAGNALIATLAADDPAQANPGTPAKLEVGVSFDGTPTLADGDTVTFESDGDTALNLKFNYNGG